ncbi:hypothetical protein ABZ372_20050 [Streptomyces sp. NPDC005921]
MAPAAWTMAPFSIPVLVVAEKAPLAGGLEAGMAEEGREASVAMAEGAGHRAGLVVARGERRPMWRAEVSARRLAT